MDSIMIRVKADPATLERLRDALVESWLHDNPRTITIADVADIRVTYVKEN